MPLAVAECTFLLAYELLNIMNHYTSVKFNENGRKWPERAANAILRPKQRVLVGHEQGRGASPPAAKCPVFALSGQL